MKKYYFILSLLLLGNLHSFAQTTLTSRATGNWSTVDTWISPDLSGTITTTIVSSTVTGVGTSFTTQLQVGAVLYRTDGTTSIGIVSAIATNTSLTLSAVASNANAAANYRTRKIPVAADNVSISDAHTVTLIDDRTCASLIVGGGTSGIFNSTANDDLTVTGNLTINEGATFEPTGSNSLFLRGNLVNNGTFNANNGANDMNVTFNGTANQTVSGTGLTTDFNNITINNTGAANDNIVEVFSTNFSTNTDFLTLTDGILKLAGTYTFSNDFFSTAGYTINADEGLWLNNPNVTVTGQNGSPTLDGLLRVTTGTYNVGTASGNSLNYNTGAFFTLEGGAVTIAGKFVGNAPTTDQITFNMSGGTLIVSNVGNAASNEGSFDIGNAGSSFTMSGGTIILKNESTGGTPLDYRNIAGTVSVTGGTVQLGTAATLGSPSFVIGVTPTTNIFPTLSLVKAVVATTATLAAPVIIRGNLNIPLSTTLNAGSQAVSINGSAAQTIGGSGTTILNALTINNTSGGVSLSGSITVNAALTLTSGILTIPTGNTLLIANGNVIGGTPFSTTKHIATQVNTGTGAKGFLQVDNIAASAAYLFPAGDGSNYLPVTLTPSAATVVANNDFSICSFNGITTNGEPGTVTAFTTPQKNNCVDAVWTVNYNGPGSPTQLVGNTNMTVGWPALLEGVNFTGYSNPTIGIAHYDGTPGWGVVVGTGDNTANTATRTNVTTFSPFGVGRIDPTGGVLAIKITYFNAAQGNGYNTLNWQATCSSSQAIFEVLRSTDGINFTAITSLTASQARCAQPFNYIDNTAPSGTVFYRLRAIDVDGRSSYSAIVKLSSQVKDIQLEGISPNPVANFAQLKINTNKKDVVYLAIVSLDGKVVYRNTVQLQPGTSVVNVDIANLPAGMYMIKGLFSDGQTNTIKFTKK